MIAAVVALAIALATVAGGAMVAIVWLARRGDKRVDTAIEAITGKAAGDVAHEVTKGELRQVRYELAVKNVALAAADEHVAALEEVLDHEAEEDVLPDDPGARRRELVRRLSKRWTAARARRPDGDPVPAGPGAALPRDAAAAPPDPPGPVLRPQ